MFLSKKEKEIRIIDLYYRQGKTFRDISKEIRVSFDYIADTLKKCEEKADITASITQTKQEEENSAYKQLAAYRLFSREKHPMQVAIDLKLKEAEVIQFYKEYWKLKRLHKANLAYVDIDRDNYIEYFLNLFESSKKESITIQQVVNVLAIADEDLPAFEDRSKRVKNDLNLLEHQKQSSDNDLSDLNDKKSSSGHILNIYDRDYECKIQGKKNLNNEISRLCNLISQFNSNDDHIKM